MKLISLPLWATGLMLATLMLIFCEEKLGEPTPGKQTDIVSSGSTGVYKDGMLNGTPIRYKEVNGRAIWQGDIWLTSQDLVRGSNPTARTKGLGLEDVNRRWPYWTIPYEISDQIPAWQVTEIIASFKDWETNTPIKFRLREGYDKDYVRFVPNALTYSFTPIGRQGSMQEVSLNNKSFSEHIKHELAIL
nr:M12 family metallopeptidase [Dyadobacter fanqingshengii]